MNSIAQDAGKLFIRLQQPTKETIYTNYSKQFIAGATCKGCTITINDTPVKVYSTGGFAYQLNLNVGDSDFIIAASNKGNTINKKIHYSFSIPKPADTVKALTIASVQSFPEGNSSLQAGDKIQFKVKALPNCTVRVGNTVLNELPASQTNGMPGIYQGEYTIKATDSFKNFRFPVVLTDKDNRKSSAYTKDTFSVFAPASNIAVTKGRLSYIEFGLGSDRLGGSKIGYLDSNILLNITGKIGYKYRVQLSKTRTAYVPDEDLLTFMPAGTLVPRSLTGNWKVYGDDKFDYVTVSLSKRLPYQSFQLIDPSKIVVDVFGATNNTNWIKQFESAKEVKNVYYEQMEDDVYRITIELKHQQLWGYCIYYNNYNDLVIQVKHQPDNLALKNLTIAVDAGHGGTNTGAVGATGVFEKDITLPIALKLQAALQKEGAKVIMTRTQEQYVDNHQRILFYRDSMPDLLLSIHLNSSEDPINVSGVSTYYRYISFKPLSNFIYKRMLELGLKEYGNTGSFNFMLNSPTEYPNALIETLFLSNPAEEEKALDENFQQQMVDKMVLGIKDFLNNCK
ncbi:N-acetylmuramoyl-L-alanine amidase [Ferruginibacter albus]|uniref:N-acetylmuramoyl-L-alanine amidase n=1 Tax=Ferruginibacter albus TaxID=2875540 RepID=UPI001CC5CCE6|nr:N-acetylmuramoyl-L-alanine amidase [Ferruginibacter albus]UAY51820.1 N-acetylmuramoyl-L-alanine amidase [Ferruginibacter albus]